MIEPDVLAELALDSCRPGPGRPWAKDIIYPLDVPEIDFQSGLDLIVIDCPARNLGLMPNGLGYVHNALKQVDVRYQTCDLDILIYHRFHIRRLFDEGGKIALAERPGIAHRSLASRTLRPVVRGPGHRLFRAGNPGDRRQAGGGPAQGAGAVDSRLQRKVLGQGGGARQGGPAGDHHLWWAAMPATARTSACAAFPWPTTCASAKPT